MADLEQGPGRLVRSKRPTGAAGRLDQGSNLERIALDNSIETRYHPADARTPPFHLPCYGGLL